MSGSIMSSGPLVFRQFCPRRLSMARCGTLSLNTARRLFMLSYFCRRFVSIPSTMCKIRPQVRALEHPSGSSVRVVFLLGLEDILSFSMPRRVPLCRCVVHLNLFQYFAFCLDIS